EDAVVCHPWIIGELLVGDLGLQRSHVLADLAALEQLDMYMLDELRAFVDRQRLFGSGLSFIDVQLLYSAIIANARIWSSDTALTRMASRFHCAHAHSGT
ncbi:MAG: VapC toxin family PIN domain ribonuclease, partial [Deltaproteobacteria bacterium]|nr:VapC toxin family PIN domain ribonuclease [Deltaproteobacteria bacterium]